MNKRMMLSLGAALSLSACAADYYGPGPAGPAYYDAYYDGFYGPFYDGYWGPGGIYYYSRGPRGRYFADRRGHFRHDIGPSGPWRGRGPAPTFAPVHGPGNFPGGAGFHGNPGGRGHGGGRHH